MYRRREGREHFAAVEFDDVPTVQRALYTNRLTLDALPAEQRGEPLRELYQRTGSDAYQFLNDEILIVQWVAIPYRKRPNA
jgi:hypothetical protein